MFTVDVKQQYNTILNFAISNMGRYKIQFPLMRPICYHCGVRYLTDIEFERGKCIMAVEKTV